MRLPSPGSRRSCLLALLILLLFGSGPAGADLRSPLPGEAWNPATLTTAISGAEGARAPREICTRASCAPRSGDSPWTVAGFGLAALGAARLGRRSSGAQSPPNSARG